MPFKDEYKILALAAFPDLDKNLNLLTHHEPISSQCFKVEELLLDLYWNTDAFDILYQRVWEAHFSQP